MRTLIRFIFISTLSGFVSMAASGQVSCGPGTQLDCNGISVGIPKVFDNRSLTLQIEALEQALQRQQAANPSIDLKAVIGALANTQGLTQSETSTVLSVLGNPTPATSLTTDLKTGNVDSNGNPLPNTTDTQTSKNLASVTPSTPSFDSFASVPSGFNPTFGSSASDLLNDQVNLSYQIMNLQMILERALSDRLDNCADPTANCTRLQTVLGFNVTIDPPRIANDAVAVVEITLTGQAKQGSSDLSLVAMMPQEKTYNSASLSSSSHAYSGAAVVNAFQVSGGYRKRNQTFYVYRDTDTLAYERMTKDGKLVFGWMFRPVLGRRSISPGLRQLFAVLALPQTDCNRSGSDTKADDCSIDLMPQVRTYWKKFDRGTQTSFEEHDANTASKLWYSFSAGLSRPQIFDKKSYVNELTYNKLTVHSSAFYERALLPEVLDVTWRPTGEKSVLVSVMGRNFFTNTQVKLGDTIYSEANKNLIIKSERSIDIVTTFDQLASGPSSILSRYGLSVPLFAPNPPNVPDTIKEGFQIERTGFKLGPPIDGYRTLEIPLGPHFDNNSGAGITYKSDKEKVNSLIGQLNHLQIDTKSKESDLDSKAKQMLALQSAKRPDRVQVSKLKTEIDALQKALDDSKAQREKIENDLDDAKWALAQSSTLGRDALLESQPPIVSVNGTALKMPYAFSDVPADRSKLTPGYVLIRTTFQDSLIANGAALIRVSLPFYNPTRWTDTLQYTDPDDEFKVDRVSEDTIVIRGQGTEFSPRADKEGRPLTGRENTCWKFIAGKTAVELATQFCPYQSPKRNTPPKTATKPVKGKPVPPPAQDQSASSSAPPIEKGSYVTSVTIGDKDKFPAHAVLLAPDFAVYHLAIPDFPDKKPDPPKPIAMKQNDSTWIEITLDVGKTARTVEANGAALPTSQWRVKKDDSKKAATSDKKDAQTLQVEITRALTAKSGSIQITVLDAAPSVIGKQIVEIACGQCSDKKGDQ